MRKPLLLIGLLFIIILLAYIKTPTEQRKITKETPIIQETFENINIKEVARLEGSGSNIDSVDFWENGEETLLFVTSKNANLVQVWQYPFDEEKETLRFEHSANGVSIDQNNDKLYIGLKTPASVHEFTLPKFEETAVFAKDLGASETNMDTYHAEGYTWIYVTENFKVHVYETTTKEELYTFEPNVSSIETILVDEYYKKIYVPDEQGAESKNTGIHVFSPEGEYLTIFAEKNIFQADEEGITIYRCLKNNKDTGKGFIIVADQKTQATDFEVFDRKTNQYLGNFNIGIVKNTDGIASSEQPLPNYPQGIFAAVDNDHTTVLVSWKDIFEETGLQC